METIMPMSESMPNIKEAIGKRVSRCFVPIPASRCSIVASLFANAIYLLLQKGHDKCPYRLFLDHKFEREHGDARKNYIKSSHQADPGRFVYRRHHQCTPSANPANEHAHN